MDVSRCISTQHPDNARSPFFADQTLIEGEAEIKEAYYAFSNLGCREQMWDYEGKEVDAFVVKKLLTRYEDFFRDHPLGRSRFLTLRVPNPRVEQAEAKILLETLESIPRSHDAARMLFGSNVPCPVFEVILPMTSSAAELNRVYHYYKEFVGGKEQQQCYDISVREWVGDYLPNAIRVIPLFENRDQLLAIELLPMIGVGSAPFRGNLHPGRVHEFLVEYPSVQTFTIQSAFKYDYTEAEAQAGIAALNRAERGPAHAIDEERSRRIIEKVSARYAKSVQELASIINEVAGYIPSRRARKLHIGLFGYSRQLEGRESIRLPRAISFCAALYSIGLPPEILGFAALGKSDLAFIREVYCNLDQDLTDALQFMSIRNLKHLPPIIRKDIEAVLDVVPLEVHDEHAKLTSGIMEDLRHGKPRNQVSEKIQRAAVCRRFLG